MLFFQDPGNNLGELLVDPEAVGQYPENAYPTCEDDDF